MRTRNFLAIAIVAMLAVGACAPTASPSPSASQSSSVPTASSPATSDSPEPAESNSPAPLAVDPAEAVIEGVEDGATITFWTYYLAPTFDKYIADTITRFEGTYPGVTVVHEDHQDTFKQDLESAFAAGNAPDVINLSVGEGWVSEYASQDLLLGLDDKVPQSVKDLYFEGLWQQQLVDGVNFQFPWYQSIAVELINTRIYEDEAGLSVADFPTAVEELPALCKTIKDKTGKVCDIRLTVNDLLAQMVYEGDVKILNDDATAFTFDSPEGVAWLQMYVQMVKDGSVDLGALTTAEDRVGLLLFSAGQAPFYQTGPNLIREVKSNNASLYEDLAVVPAPVGKSGVVGKGSMGISVKADTQYPNASIALAQYFTNPRAMLEFAQTVAIYPSTPSSYDDPFFATTPELIEDSARPIARDIVSRLADIVPTVPEKKEVNEIVRRAIESALVGGVDPQQALSDAVAQANALLQ